jgi:hypothetical protein
MKFLRFGIFWSNITRAQNIFHPKGKPLRFQFLLKLALVHKKRKRTPKRKGKLLLIYQTLAIKKSLGKKFSLLHERSVDRIPHKEKRSMMLEKSNTIVIIVQKVKVK